MHDETVELKTDGNFKWDTPTEFRKFGELIFVTKLLVFPIPNPYELQGFLWL